MRKRVAIWLYGGIGTGNFSQGQPVLEKLIVELCTDFEIVVYSQSLVNSGYFPKEFKIRFASHRVKNGSMRWFYLLIFFLKDHFRDKYNVLCAFWGFPGGFLATLLARMLGLPSLVNLQGGDAVGISSLNYGVMHRPLFKKLALWTYQKATLLIALTYYQSDLISQYGVSRSIRIIPFGADRLVFKHFLKEKNDSPINFIHVANYNPIKDTPTLLKAFAIIAKRKGSRLRIIGGQYEKSNGRQLCKELGIESMVEFCGPVVYEEIHKHYEWADVMMHTSLYEGQGIVVAEAAMCGLLIAGTSVGLIADLGDRAAIIVSPGDYELLAEKILEALDQPAIADTKKAGALQWATAHDSDWTADQFKRNLNEVMQVRSLN